MSADREQRVEFSIVLPAYNEASTVASVVEAHHAALRPLFGSFEIIIVDDASRDGTFEAATEVARRFAQVRVYRNEHNRGQAGSLVVGFGIARGDVVMHNAFDMPFAPEDIAIVKAAAQSADVVVVERADRAAYNFTRKLVSRANVILLRALFRCPIGDYNFVQAYRREVLDHVRTRSTAAGTLTPELIVRARRAGFRVDTVLAPYHARRIGRSTVTARTVASSLVQTLGLVRMLRIDPTEPWKPPPAVSDAPARSSRRPPEPVATS